MIVQLMTGLLLDHAPACPVRVGLSVNGRAQVAFRLPSDWLRHLSTALLLLAVSAFFLQPLAHAGPSGRSAHHDVAITTMAQPCAYTHSSDYGHEASIKHCEQDNTVSGVVDCCPTCLVAAITPESQSLTPHASSEHLRLLVPNHIGRVLPGILRPPRLNTSA